MLDCVGWFGLLCVVVDYLLVGWCCGVGILFW